MHSYSSNNDNLPPHLSSNVRQLISQRLIEIKNISHSQKFNLNEKIQSNLSNCILLGSNFIYRSITSRPELLDQLFASNTGIYNKRQLNYIKNKITKIDGSKEYITYKLRQIRQEEVVRLGWRDLAGSADLSEVISTMSELADASIQKALDSAATQVSEIYGQAIGETTGKPVQMTVLGLGKLGGCELNLSSDVDLIFCFRENGITNGAKSISNHEYFVKTGQVLIDILSNPSPEGIVFRVDMRLRPNGDSGPLALSFDAIDHYFLTHGRDWERYALIKARPIAGDLSAGKDLLETLRPFIYRKYLDFSAFDSIRKMKTLIEQSIKRKDFKNNIKIGRGGIREIEFFIQSQQLIYGGRYPELRTPSIFKAITGLESLKIISEKECLAIREQYKFLRILEHRLQIMDDAQTHVLPTDSEVFSRIAIPLNFQNPSDLISRLNQISSCVHERFIFFLNRNNENSESNQESQLNDLWLGNQDESSQTDTLRNLGFCDISQVNKLLSNIRNSRFYQSFSSEGRERLDRLVPAILKASSNTNNPDTALSRLIFVIQSIGRRSAYLSLLNENPLALEQLTRLVNASAEISHWVASNPIILDELLDPITNFDFQEHGEIENEISNKLSVCENHGLEESMDILRHYHQGYNLKIAAADLANIIDFRLVSISLSNLAHAILQKSLSLAVKTLKNIDIPDTNSSLGVIAYGKLGSLELGYNSDLDMVFIYEQPQEESTCRSKRRYYYSRLVQRFLHILSTRTPAGDLYTADTRLRPSGHSGTLVTPLQAYAEYLKESAWTWELQALIRARLILGDHSLKIKFEELRKQILCKKRDADILKNDIIKMRSRIRTNHKSTLGFNLKYDSGGLIDVEFLCQYLVLNYASSFPELADCRSSLDIIDKAKHLNLVSSKDGEALEHVIKSYLTKQHNLKLNRLSVELSADSFVLERESISLLWLKYIEH